MGNPVSVGLYLTGGADYTSQPFLFRTGNDHAVLPLDLNRHLDTALALITLLSLRLFSLFSTAAFEVSEAIEEAAPQGNSQNKSDNDSFYVHCTPPVISVATDVSSFDKAVCRS